MGGGRPPGQRAPAYPVRCFWQSRLNPLGPNVRYPRRNDFHGPSVPTLGEDGDTDAEGLSMDAQRQPAVTRFSWVAGALFLALCPGWVVAQEPAARAAPPAPSASAPAALPRGPAGSPERRPGGLPLPLPPRGGGGGRVTPPGLPPRNGRPRPGSSFDPGAAGPGISRRGGQNFLDGALDPRSGWPFVLLDHFQPRPERLERFWVVQTRGCPQEMGTEPWPDLQVLHFGADGSLEERDPRELMAQVGGRPVLIQVQGSLTTPDIALGGLLWTHSWLEYNRVLPDDAVLVAFDWPSQRVYRNDVRDINEKGRRAYVAAYHLARFVQGFPPSSRICLLGQSYGGRVVPSALHLLGGGCLNSQEHDPPVRLPTLRPDLMLRGVIVAAADDHDWLNPGQRLDHALVGCEAFLNLYNRRDEALTLYPFLIRSGHRRALGRIGLTNRDFEKLGPLACRYLEFDVHDVLQREHSLLDAVANPIIARKIAPYIWNFNPPPGPPQEETPEVRPSRFR